MTERFVCGSVVTGVLACMALTGCVKFESQPLEPERIADNFAARSLEDPNLRAFVAANLSAVADTDPVTPWDLDSLTLAAFYFQPDLDVARAGRAVAEADRIKAGERPGIGLSLIPGSNTTTSTPSARIATLTADISLETAGKRGYRAAQAAQLAEAARLNIATVAWEVRSQVRRSLLAMYGAIETGALLERKGTIYDENVQILLGQYAAGAVSAFELTQARVAADEARLALRDTERQEAEARAQLARALGVPVRALDGVDFSFDPFVSAPDELPLAALRAHAVIARTDLLRSLAEYAASQSALQLEVARQYPDLHLGPGYEYDQGDNKWSLGLSVSLPPARNRGAIAVASARREESAARFEALQAGILGQIDEAAAAINAARTKLANADSLLTGVARQAQIADGMFSVGAISRAQLSAIKLQLNAAEQSRFNALLEIQQAAGLVEDAVQTPLNLPGSVWEIDPRSAFAGSSREDQ